MRLSFVARRQAVYAAETVKGLAGYGWDDQVSIPSRCIDFCRQWVQTSCCVHSPHIRIGSYCQA
jgi:hypothetical protein